MHELTTALYHCAYLLVLKYRNVVKLLNQYKSQEFLNSFDRCLTKWKYIFLEFILF